MTKPLAFATQSVKLGAWSAERMINYYPVTFPEGSAAGTVMARQHAGLKARINLWGASGYTYPIRCMIQHAGDLFAFAGGVIFRVKRDGTFTPLIYPIDPTGGNAIEDDADATMASDGLKIAIVANNRYAVVTVTGDDTASVTYPSLPQITNAKSVTFLNQRMIVTGAGSGRGDVIATSDPLDAETFQSAAYGTAESDPDGLVQGYTVGDVFYALGTATIEPMYDAGSGNFPLRSYSGGTIPHGLLNRRAVTSDGQMLYWVSKDKRIFRAAGFQAQEISHPGVQRALDAIGGVRCFMFTDGESTFFAVRIPDNTTWCFDLRSQRWSERSTGISEGPWLARCAARFSFDGQAYEVQLVGGNDGTIYEVDAQTYVDGTRTLRRWIVSQPIMQRGFSVDYLEPYLSTGLTPLGRTPQITLYRSRSGRGFAPVSMRSLGASGDYDRRVYWNGLGHFQRRGQFALEVTDECRADIFGVEMEAR